MKNITKEQLEHMKKIMVKAEVLIPVVHDNTAKEIKQ